MINNKSFKHLQVCTQVFYVIVFGTLACLYGIQCINDQMPDCTYSVKFT